MTKWQKWRNKNNLTILVNHNMVVATENFIKFMKSNVVYAYILILQSFLLDFRYK